jgi:3-oxoadipate enol-lactonase
MPFSTVDDVRLYWERVGDPSGPPVLFVNGTGGDLRARPSPLTGPLADGFDLLGYDQRGLGQSDKPDERYTMASYAADALGLVDEVAGWEQFAVLGVSFGGMVAQELALLAPDRVERLVLCCTSSGGKGGSSYPLHELAALDPEERLVRTVLISDTSIDRTWLDEHPEIVDLVRARSVGDPNDPAATAGALRQLEARRDHDTYDRLPSLTMPTLVCAGRTDGIAPLANSEAIAARIPDAELAVFDGGHAFLMSGKPWQRIVEFLRGT